MPRHLTIMQHFLQQDTNTIACLVLPAALLP